MCLVNDEHAVLTRALRTRPSLSGNVSSTTALGQQLRLVLSSAIKTTSPTTRLRFCLNHLCRACKHGMYNFSHCDQNSSAKNCTSFQDLRYPSARMNRPGDKSDCNRPVSNIFGVRGRSSAGSLLTGVIGRLLIICSTSTIKKCSVSSFNILSIVSADKTFRMVRITRSHTPPWWLAAGGLKCHFVA